MHLIYKGYPRSLLRPDVECLLELNKQDCQVKAEYILPQMRPVSLPTVVDELPRTTMEYGDRETVAYLAWQFPFTYGCMHRVFSELKKRIPKFAPNNIFDFGLGPATAIL